MHYFPYDILRTVNEDSLSHDTINLSFRDQEAEHHTSYVKNNIIVMNKIKLIISLTLLFLVNFSFNNSSARIVDTIEALQNKSIGKRKCNWDHFE